MSNHQCCGCVSLSLSHNCILRWSAVHAGGTLPSPPAPSFGMWVGCGSDVRHSVVVGLRGKRVRSSKCQTTPAAINRLETGSGSQTFSGSGAPRSSQAMEEILDGSIWCMISPLLTPDDAVMSRTVTSRWNVGDRCGTLGDFYFMLLHSDQ